MNFHKIILELFIQIIYSLLHTFFFLLIFYLPLRRFSFTKTLNHFLIYHHIHFDRFLINNFNRYNDIDNLIIIKKKKSIITTKNPIRLN